MSTLAQDLRHLRLAAEPRPRQSRTKRPTHTEFVCPTCGQRASAAPDASLICGSCYDDEGGDVCIMVVAPYPSPAV